jgi:hypothetical protein
MFEDLLTHPVLWNHMGCFDEQQPKVAIGIDWNGRPTSCLESMHLPLESDSIHCYVRANLTGWLPCT